MLCICLFCTLQRTRRDIVEFGDSGYYSDQVWVLSVGAKLVSAKWPVRNKAIMKKTDSTLFFHLQNCPSTLLSQN